MANHAATGVTAYGNSASTAERSADRPVLPADRNYAVLGTGAVGGFYGSLLQHGGAEVHFLLNTDFDHVASQGLLVDSSKRGIVFAPKVHAYNDAQKMPQCDVVLVAWKATANHLLPAILPGLLKENGVVVILQNGLGIESEVAAVVGAERVMGCTCYITALKTGPGHILHTDKGEIVLAEYQDRYAPAGISERMRQISQDFERGGVPATLDPDLFVARWRKLVWNVTFNGLSVVLQARTDVMLADPDVQQLCREVMREVLQGLHASVANLTPELVGSRGLPQELIEAMLTMTAKVEYKTSMLIDFEMGRPLELGAVYLGVLRYAREAGCTLPRIESLYQQLAFLDRRNMRRHIKALSPTSTAS